MEKREDWPDSGRSYEFEEPNLETKAAAIIWTGVNYYWGDDFVNTAGPYDEIKVEQSRETGSGILSYELYVGQMPEFDEDDEDGETFIMEGTLVVIERSEDEELHHGLKQLYVNNVIDLKKASGKSDSELDLDEELRDIHWAKHYACEVSAYSFGTDPADGLQVMKSYQLRNDENEIVWSSHFDSEPDAGEVGGLTELDSEDSQLATTISQDDYFMIHGALVRLLNVPPEILDRQRAA